MGKDRGAGVPGGVVGKDIRAVGVLIDYLACWPQTALLDHVIADLATRAGLETQVMPEGVRISRRGGLVFALNASTAALQAPAPPTARFLVGGPLMPAAGVTIWTEP